MSIRALFFDLDDTLLETHRAHSAAIMVGAGRVAAVDPRFTAEAVHAAFARVHRAHETQLEAGALSFPSHLGFRRRTWEEALRRLGADESLADELAALYVEERRRRYRLYEEVEETLEELAGRYRLVLVTNGLGELQREKVAAVRLERWFPHLAISGELQSWKPDAAIFRHALELAGAAPGEAVMLGDALERDVRGARDVGMRSVWVRRYPHLQPVPGLTPDAEVADLRGLGTLLEGW